jgi:hypothetical protein
MSSLSAQLRRFESAINDKKFVPLDVLESVITEHNIRVELESTAGWLHRLSNWVNPSDVPQRVVENAKKVFATLVLMGKAIAIYDLLEDGLTDDHLPLHRDTQYNHLLSCDSARKFAFVGWPEHLLDIFIEDKQPLFLAPVLPNDGQLIRLDQNCALPFINSDSRAVGAGGIVYWAKVHHKHQQGYEVSVLLICSP